MFLKEDEGKQAIRRSISPAESCICKSSVSTSTGADERLPNQTVSDLAKLFGFKPSFLKHIFGGGRGPLTWAALNNLQCQLGCPM